MNYPEIRIQDGWLLRNNVSNHLHELWAKKEDRLADDKEMERIVIAYEKAWKSYGEKVIKGMCELYGLEFRQSYIDVYIAPWFQAFSNPMVIGVTFSPDVFVDTLTHELLHRLFTDNKSIPYQTGILAKEWPKLFGKDHDFSTLVHIPVHAGLKAIYLDILNEPKRYNRDLEKTLNSKDKWVNPYKKAWKYVEKNDYKLINKRLKNNFTSLKK